MHFIHCYAWLSLSSLLALAACSNDAAKPDTSASSAAETGHKASGASGSASGGTAGRSASGGDGTLYGQKYEGGLFHLGPVDYEESQWHNACAAATKYSQTVRTAEGDLLAGLWSGIRNVANYCDACIVVTTTKGKTANLRVVTYGDTSDNSIDVSPHAFEILNTGENPRSMTWQFAKCPDTGKITYEFQTGSSEWWTSFWLRNARVPITKVEAKGPTHDYATLERGSDGTLTDGGGFGNGPFSIRITGIDGQQLVHNFDWPSGGIAGKTLTAPDNFK